MMEVLPVTLWRCTFCAKEWYPRDGVDLAELCPFQHEHARGWYRAGHHLNTVTITIPDDPSGLFEDRS